LRVEEVLLGDDKIGLRQVQAALDLVHVGEPVNARFAPELDLVGDALVQRQVFLCESNNGLVFQNFQVDVNDFQSSVVSRAADDKGFRLYSCFLPVDLIHGGEAGEKILPQPNPRLLWVKVIVERFIDVILTRAGFNIKGREVVCFCLPDLLVSCQPVMRNRADVGIGLNHCFNSLLQGFGV